MQQNPFESGKEFPLTLANPNPKSSKTKDGPVYRVSFEIDQDTFLNFMDTETKGMVIECVCQVTHYNDPVDETKQDVLKVKGGPLSKRSEKLAQDPEFHSFLRGLGVFDGKNNTHENEVARAYIRNCCGVSSRAQIDSRQSAAIEFHRLLSKFNQYQTQNGAAL